MHTQPTQRRRYRHTTLVAVLLTAMCLNACSAADTSGTAANTAATLDDASSLDRTMERAANVAANVPVEANLPAYDRAMSRLAKATSYHFIFTIDVHTPDEFSKPSRTVAKGTRHSPTSAMQYTLTSNNPMRMNGEWISIGNGKEIFYKKDGSWTNEGLLAGDQTGFFLDTMLVVVTLRNSTDPANSTAPSPIGSKTINGRDCDHYQVKLPEQTYDVYIDKASGDLAQAEMSNRNSRQTLEVSRMNEPVSITAPM